MSGLHLDIPPLETERLVLRAPRPGDYPGFRDFFGSPRAQMTGGPVAPAEAWRRYATLLGHWVMRGYGMWMITLKGSDAAVGHTGLWRPETWPEPEIGWIVYEGAEGRGIAFEAASAVRDHVFGTLGWQTVVSYIRRGNTRSVALAERLGAVADATAPRPPHAPDCLVYRHPAPGSPR